MKFKNFCFLPIVGSITLPIISISCSNQADIEIDETKVKKEFLKKLNITQLASLHNFEPIFFLKNDKTKEMGKIVNITDNNELVFNSNIKYKPDFKLKKSWQQIKTIYNNYKIERVDASESNILNNFFTQYNVEDVKTNGGFTNNWFYYLANLNKEVDYYRVLDPYFFDFQTIIFRLVNDIKTNTGLMNLNNLMNNQNEPFIARNIFNNEYIQANSWLSEESSVFRESFLNFLVLYLNKFDLKVKKIVVDWSKSTIINGNNSASSLIGFKIKKIINFNDEDIINNEIKEKTFYINGFRNYASEQKFGVGHEGLKESLPLFNDYVKNPYLTIKQDDNLNLGKDINSFIKGYNSIDFWNSRGLVHLLSNFKDSLIVEIPKIYKNIDKKYEIIDVQFSNYYKTSQIIKLIVRVHKMNGKTKDFVWLSSNFDDHGHLLKAIAIKFLPVDQLKSIDYAIYKKDNPVSFEGLKIEEISNDELFTKLIQKALNKSKTHINNLSQDQHSNLIKLFTSYLNNYILAYAIETNESNLNSGIKKIELLNTETNNEKIDLTFGFYKFLSADDFKFKNENEKPFFQLKISVNNLFNTSNSDIEIISKEVVNE